MKSIWRSGFVLAILAIVLIVAGLWYVFCVDERPEGVRQQGFVSRRVKGVDPAKMVAKRGFKKLQRRSAVPIKADKQPAAKPDLKLDDKDEAKLTAEIKALYVALQEALDAGKRQDVFELVRKLQSSKEWPDGIPFSVKQRALDALAWFGASGMSEAIGFLADADPEVQEVAIEKFEEMIGDMDIGDRARADILKQIVKVVHDKDALDTFYMELNNMRPTVKAETALAIYESGNADAVSVLKENVEFVFSDADVEYEVKDQESISRYLKDAEQECKDDPEKAQEYEEFYGVPKE